MKNDEIIYSIRTTNQFRKSLKRMSKRGYNFLKKYINQNSF